jgi:hypothetical protein
LTQDDCAHDDDCGDQQVCQLIVYTEDACDGGDPEAIVSAHRFCEQHCQSDDDCAEDMLCLCDATGDGLNRCVSTLQGVEGACRGDDDCGTSMRCLGTAWGVFMCQHPLDACAVDADCGQGMYCAPLFDPEAQAYRRKCVEDMGPCVRG